MEESAEKAAAVDVGGLFHFHRDRIHQAADQEGGHRDTNGTVQENHSSVCVIESELVDDHKIGYHQSVQRHQNSRSKECEDLLSSPEAET